MRKEVSDFYRPAPRGLPEWSLPSSRQNGERNRVLIARGFLVGDRFPQRRNEAFMTRMAAASKASDPR